MAEYTVFDIKGKGFKYEQYAQEQENAPPPTGTFGCFIGTSNWGPINTPYVVTGGSLEFKEVFGYAGTRVDHGWDAANLHFRANSALGNFTRLADENVATRSSFILRNKSDKPATLSGITNILNGVLIDETNNQLKFNLGYKLPGISETDVVVNVNLSSLHSQKATLTSRIINTDNPITLVSNQTKVVITVKGPDDFIRIFTILANSNTTINNNSAFFDFITSDSYSTTSVTNGSGAPVNGDDLAEYFIFDYGTSGRLTITANSFDYTFRIVDNTIEKAFSRTLDNNPVKTPYYAVLNAINDAANAAISENSDITANYKIADIGENGNLVLTGINTGTDSWIELIIQTTPLNINTIISLFGIENPYDEDGYNEGSDGVNIGTFRAKYRGVEGNTIKLRFYKETGISSIGIFFRNALVATISDYNFDISSDNFLGSIIANDSIANAIIQYDHGKQYYDFNDSDDLTATAYDLYFNEDPIENIAGWVIENGTYSLSGGNSGEDSNELNFNILSVIEELKNVDLYQIDFIAAPGYEEENVQNALLNLCAHRQDCFAFIDMPYITGTSTRDAVNKAVRYINGTYLRTEKIDSIYGVLAFPYVTLRKRYYNSQNILASELTVVSPTTILPYLYTLKDITTGTTFDIAAGESFGGRILLSTTDFVDVQFKFTQEDRDLLYADSLDACINPISFNTEVGYFLDGQKTTLRKNLNGKLTSLSRISVMRTGLFIKKVSYRISRQYFFAPIDPITWRDFSNRLSREIMQILVSSRMIEPNFIVKCDSVTNTDAVRNNNGMVAYIEFTPYKKLERIKVIANITETDTTLTLA
jgi:hypothetical protein